MGIEVKELHIKAVVAPEPADKDSRITTAMLEKLKKEIVRECMQELKMVINEQKER